MLVLACGGSGNDAGTVARCTNNAECDDMLFCNGSETCDPSNLSSNARGCVAGADPCVSTKLLCDESFRRCGDGAVTTNCDVDNDGHRAIACGGDDCNDDDVDLFPGNPERCEGVLKNGRSAADHDEDCNACTVSGMYPEGDSDGDGYVRATCTNPWSQDFGKNGVPVGCLANQVRLGLDRVTYGSDCDDAARNVHPFQAEVCNGIDDNCDGNVDEGFARDGFEDLDGDGFGDPEKPVAACPGLPTHALRAGDCDDQNAAIFPDTQICVDAEHYALCSATGVFSSPKPCASDPQFPARCQAQPNGLGICLDGQ